MKKRNIVIDFLRFIGIIQIFISHGGFDGNVRYLCDEVLAVMFFTSGLSFAESSFTFSKGNYFHYLKKRFLRLILPVWIFMVVFFLLFHFIPGFDFSLSVILKSYSLTAGGILFVWVYRVFFIASATMPLFDKAFKKLSPCLSLIICYVLILGNDFLYQNAFAKMNSAVSGLLSYLITYTIGYGVISWLGVLFGRLSARERRWFCAISGIIALTCSKFFGCVDKYPYTFPPQIYFVSWGLLESSVIYLLCQRFYRKDSPVIRWFSSNSNRLYLAHAPVYYLIVEHIRGGMARFILELGIAVCLVLVYNSISQIIKKKETAPVQK